jgi:hypothetical protein
MAVLVPSTDTDELVPVVHREGDRLQADTRGIGRDRCSDLLIEVREVHLVGWAAVTLHRGRNNVF